MMFFGGKYAKQTDEKKSLEKNVYYHFNRLWFKKKHS